jgi:hypothetical protein
MFCFIILFSINLEILTKNNNKVLASSFPFYNLYISLKQPKNKMILLNDN